MGATPECYDGRALLARRLSTLQMPFNIGPFELLLVLILALLILGPGKLPEVGQALGRTLREFRHATSDVEEAARIDTSLTTPTPARPAPQQTEARAAPVESDSDVARASEAQSRAPGN